MRLAPGMCHVMFVLCVHGLFFFMRLMHGVLMVCVHGMLLFLQCGLCFVRGMVLMTFWHGSLVLIMACVPGVLSMVQVVLFGLVHSKPPLYSSPLLAFVL